MEKPFKIEKRSSRGNKYGLSKEAQDRGRVKDSLKSAMKKGLQCHQRATEQGLTEDEAAMIDRVHKTNASGKQWWRKQLFLKV